MRASAREMVIHPTSTGYEEATFYPSGDPTYAKTSGDLYYGVLLNYPHNAYNYNACLKFNLDSLPDTCIIMSADLHYYQYEHWVGLPKVDVKLIRDPDLLSAGDLWTEIAVAQALTSEYDSRDTWMTLPLNPSAFSLLDSCGHAGCASFGIRKENENTFTGLASGSAPAPYLRIVYCDPSESDIQVVRGEPPYPLIAGRADTALLVLMNKGLRSSDPFWVYATAPGLSPESALAGVIQVGDTASVRLPLPVPHSANSMVHFKVRAACTGDPSPGDDTTGLSCWVFPPSAYAAEGFDMWLPPLRWVVVDNDGGSQTWERRSDNSGSHSGVGFAACFREQTGPTDDWLISGPVYPRLDEPDSVGFYFRAYLAGPPTNLQTWAMRGHRIADTIRTLASGQVSQNVYLRQTASLDTFDGDTIYIGFRCQSSGAWNGLCLDDVWFSGFVPPDTNDTTDTTPKPQRDAVRRAVAHLPDFAFAPNPSGRMDVTVRCSLAVGKRRTLTMRDVVGRAVRTFDLDPSGIARLDLRGLPSGVYMARLEAGTQSLTRKLILTAR